MTTIQLIAKLQIWKNENLPENELIQEAIDRLEELDEKIEEIENRVDWLLLNQMP